MQPQTSIAASRRESPAKLLDVQAPLAIDGVASDLDLHSPHPNPDQSRICVVGAGPSGLAALKVIKDAPQYKQGLWTLVAFEARENIGGVWLPAPPIDNPPLTPLYDSLTTNIPHPVMAYTSFSFPPSTPVFPHASVVERYLVSYAEHFDLVRYIRLNTTVESVERHHPNSEPDGRKQWMVKVSTGESFLFDLVIVCNGHFRIPRYPDAPGVERWLKKGKATHSVWYRRPQYMGNTVLVVGGRPSGNDISDEMLSVSQTVIHSVRGGNNEDIGGKLKKRGAVVRFEDEEEGKVVFEDGTVESGIDHCILATGYQASLPFLDSVIRKGLPPPGPPVPSSELYNTTYSVFPLSRHIFPLQDPTLTFIGLLVRAIPFPLAEAQARAIIHVFSHPSAFDPTQESIDVLSRYERLRSQLGTDDPEKIAKIWDLYSLIDTGFFDYRDSLFEFAQGTFEDVVKYERWEHVMTMNRDSLVTVWKGLEESGEAEEWVKGVGEKGKEEWVEVLERMLNKARQMGLPVIDDL